jgi:hypothetical protein
VCLVHIHVQLLGQYLAAMYIALCMPTRHGLSHDNGLDEIVFTAHQQYLIHFEMPENCVTCFVSVSLIVDTRVSDVSSYSQVSPSYNLKPSMWQEGEGYQCLNNLWW